MKLIQKTNNYAYLFGLFGASAIILSGVFAAFSAHAPTHFALWSTAYGTLVVGVVQLCIAAALYYSARTISMRSVAAVFLAYNVGNAGVLLGTYLDEAASTPTALVNIGGILISLSLLAILYLLRNRKPNGAMLAFYVVIIGTLICVPIGLLLAQR